MTTQYYREGRANDSFFSFLMMINSLRWQVTQILAPDYKNPLKKWADFPNAPGICFTREKKKNKRP